MLLGLGRDGHTASLFANTEALAATEQPAVAVTAFYDDRPAERVTLTLPVLNHARHVLFLVCGHAKAEAVQAVLADEEGQLPARRVRPTAGHLAWLMDAAAAVSIRPPDSGKW